MCELLVLFSVLFGKVWICKNYERWRWAVSTGTEDCVEWIVERKSPSLDGIRLKVILRLGDLLRPALH